MSLLQAALTAPTVLDALLQVPAADPIWGRRILCLQAPCGAGKSYAMRTLFGSGPLDLITHRRRLVGQLSQTFHATNYSTYRGSRRRDVMATDPRFAVTSHSAWILCDREVPDTVILDEAVQVVRSIATEPTYRHRVDCLAQLARRLQLARRVVLLDADLDTRFILTLCRVFGLDPGDFAHVSVSTGRPPVPLRVVPSGERLAQLLSEHASQQRSAWVCCSRTRAVMHRRMLVDAGIPDSSILTLDRNSPPSAFVNISARTHPIVLATPAVGSGFSIDTVNGRPAYERVFCDLTFRLHPDEVQQWIQRVRGGPPVTMAIEVMPGSIVTSEWDEREQADQLLSGLYGRLKATRNPGLKEAMRWAERDLRDLARGDYRRSVSHVLTLKGFAVQTERKAWDSAVYRRLKRRMKADIITGEIADILTGNDLPGLQAACRALWIYLDKGAVPETDFDVDRIAWWVRANRPDMDLMRAVWGDAIDQEDIAYDQLYSANLKRTVAEPPRPHLTRLVVHTCLERMGLDPLGLARGDLAVLKATGGPYPQDDAPARLRAFMRADRGRGGRLLVWALRAPLGPPDDPWGAVTWLLDHLALCHAATVERDRLEDGSQPRVTSRAVWLPEVLCRGDEPDLCTVLSTILARVHGRALLGRGP